MQALEAARIAGGGLSVECLNHGASLRGLRLAGVSHSLVLGLAQLEDYPGHTAHMGAIAGRVANRLAGGRIAVGGAVHQGPRNAGGVNMLHGGDQGFGRRLWHTNAHTDTMVTYTLASAHGDAGFPGNLEVSCTYQCVGGGTLRIELRASTDRPTLVNLAPHPYFNLDGRERIDDHVLRIDAARYTPTGPGLVPTGEIVAVADTGVDFRTAHRLGHTAHDQNYCLALTRREDVQPCAVLRAGKVMLEMATSEPGLQLYTGDSLNVSSPGLDGRHYAPRAGLCLESQSWPDASNQSSFPSIELCPQALYKHVTEYRFTLS